MILSFPILLQMFLIKMIHGGVPTKILFLLLSMIGKAESPVCPCGHPSHNGHHVTFHCPIWAHQRTALIGARKQWADLDDPIWIKTGPDKEDIFEGGEEWFGFIFGSLA